MSELLEYLNIRSKKDYHGWCVSNHPDRSADPDATRRFQIVSQTWKKSTVPINIVILKDDDVEDVLHCTAHVDGTVGNRCWRRRETGSDKCFYHQPGTAHMSFVDDIPYFFFAASSTMHFERNGNTCTARLLNDRFCNKHRTTGSLFCRACSKRRPRYNSC